MLIFEIDISIPGFLRLNFIESLILGKVVGSGGAGDLYAAEVINQSLIDQFKERFVVVKYVKGFFHFFSFFFEFHKSNNFLCLFKVFQVKKKKDHFNISMMKLQLIG